jgi:hypothetical protein
MCSSQHSLTNQIRRYIIESNGTRIEKANSESAIWRIVTEIRQPPKSTEWNFLKNGERLCNKKEVVDMFNTYFAEKINVLMEDIDQSRNQ